VHESGSAASNTISEDRQDQQSTTKSNGQLMESDTSVTDFWSQDRRSLLDRRRSPAEQEKLAERIQLLQAQATWVVSLLTADGKIKAKSV
jgi:hypothetical protein